MMEFFSMQRYRERCQICGRFLRKDAFEDMKHHGPWSHFKKEGSS